MTIKQSVCLSVCLSAVSSLFVIISEICLCLSVSVCVCLCLSVCPIHTYIFSNMNYDTIANYKKSVYLSVCQYIYLIHGNVHTDKAKIRLR